MFAEKNKAVKRHIRRLIHEFFDVGIVLKGIDGLFELIGGILLIFINPRTLNKIIFWLTQHELSEDPKDFFANHLIHLAQTYSFNMQIFGSIYLLVHGIIKIFLIFSLWKRKLWAYPTAIIFFSIFAIYQIYRYIFNHSIWLIILTVLDVFVIGITYLEYRRLRHLL